MSPGPGCNRPGRARVSPGPTEPSRDGAGPTGSRGVAAVTRGDRPDQNLPNHTPLTRRLKPAGRPAALAHNQQTTLNNGYLGSRNDEERSEMRYLM